MGKKLHRNSNSVLRRLLVRGLKVIIFVGVPLIIFLFTFRLKDVTVTGSERYTPEQIKQQVLKTKLDYNAVLLYLKYRYFADVKIPFVEKLDFKLKDKNTVSIRVYDKLVTGCIDFMGEYLYFDKDGIIVESSAERLKNIPQIKGLKFNKIILNEKLEVQKEELFDVILNLTRQINKYKLDVSSISFDSNYEVTLDCGDIKALLGKKSTYDEVLSELKNMIAASEGMKLTIDMRNYEKGKGVVAAVPEQPTD